MNLDFWFLWEHGEGFHRTTGAQLSGISLKGCSAPQSLTQLTQVSQSHSQMHDRDQARNRTEDGTIAISEGSFCHRMVPSLVPSLKALELPRPLHKYMAGFHFFPHHRAFRQRQHENEGRCEEINYFQQNKM